MQQKTTWIHYLITGIITSSILLSSCEKDEEFKIITDLKFINETNATILYSSYNEYLEDTVLLFTIPPTSIHTIQETGYGHENISMEDNGKGALNDLQGEMVLVEFNDIKSVIYREGEGSNSIDNYISEKLGTRHFSYTYTFTNEIMEN